MVRSNKERSRRQDSLDDIRTFSPGHRPQRMRSKDVLPSPSRRQGRSERSSKRIEANSSIRKKPINPRSRRGQTAPLVSDSSRTTPFFMSAEDLDILDPSASSKSAPRANFAYSQPSVDLSDLIDLEFTKESHRSVDWGPSGAGTSSRRKARPPTNFTRSRWSHGLPSLLDGPVDTAPPRARHFAPNLLDLATSDSHEERGRASKSSNFTSSSGTFTNPQNSINGIPPIEELLSYSPSASPPKIRPPPTGSLSPPSGRISPVIPLHQQRIGSPKNLLLGSGQPINQSKRSMTSMTSKSSKQSRPSEGSNLIFDFDEEARETAVKLAKDTKPVYNFLDDPNPDYGLMTNKAKSRSPNKTLNFNHQNKAGRGVNATIMPTFSAKGRFQAAHADGGTFSAKGLFGNLPAERAQASFQGSRAPEVQNANDVFGDMRPERSQSSFQNARAPDVEGTNDIFGDLRPERSRSAYGNTRAPDVQDSVVSQRSGATRLSMYTNETRGSIKQQPAQIQGLTQQQQPARRFLTPTTERGVVADTPSSATQGEDHITYPKRQGSRPEDVLSASGGSYYGREAEAFMGGKKQSVDDVTVNGQLLNTENAQRSFVDMEGPRAPFQSMRSSLDNQYQFDHQLRARAQLGSPRQAQAVVEMAAQRLDLQENWPGQSVKKASFIDSEPVRGPRSSEVSPSRPTPAGLNILPFNEEGPNAPRGSFFQPQQSPSGRHLDPLGEMLDSGNHTELLGSMRGQDPIKGPVSRMGNLFFESTPDQSDQSRNPTPREILHAISKEASRQSVPPPGSRELSRQDSRKGNLIEKSKDDSSVDATGGDTKDNVSSEDGGLFSTPVNQNSRSLFAKDFVPNGPGNLYGSPMLRAIRAAEERTERSLSPDSRRSPSPGNDRRFPPGLSPMQRSQSPPRGVTPSRERSPDTHPNTLPPPTNLKETQLPPTHQFRKKKSFHLGPNMVLDNDPDYVTVHPSWKFINGQWMRVHFL